MEATRPNLTLPRDVAKFVTATYQRARCILEYGSGGSTVVASELPGKTIFSVESDKGWADNLRRYLEGSDQTRSMPLMFHADIGPTHVWGWPVGRNHNQSFHKYPLEIWNHPQFSHPDTVLIDGRFRVACFYAVLLCAKRPMTVLFDDYGDRPEYFVVERFFKPKKIVGRMAVFDTRPLAADAASLSDLIEAIYRPA